MSAFEPEPFDDPPAHPAPPPPAMEPEPFDDIDEAMPSAPVHVPEVLEPEAPQDQEQALARQSTDLVTRAKALVIVNPSTFEQAGQFLQTLKDKKRQIVEFFEGDIQRAHATWKGLTTKRAGFVDPLEQAIDILSSRYATFAREERAKAERERREREEAARRAEQERLQAEARAREEEARRLEQEALTASSRAEGVELQEQAELAAQEAAQLKVDAATVPAPVLPLQSAIELPKGTSVRANWTFRVDDKLALIKAVAAGEISAAAVEPSDTYLRARAKADKDTIKIPGVTFFDQGSVAHRRSR